MRQKVESAARTTINLEDQIIWDIEPIYSKSVVSHACRISTPVQKTVSFDLPQQTTDRPAPVAMIQFEDSE